MPSKVTKPAPLRTMTPSLVPVTEPELGTPKLPLPSAVMSGFAPAPDFWKTILFVAEEPEAVRAPGVSINVDPAATLKISEPPAVLAPWAFTLAIAEPMDG